MDSRARARPIGYFGFVSLLVLLFINPLVSLAVHAAWSNIHSYILLVPFVSVYLICIQRKRLPKEYESSPRLAIIPLAAGFAALIVGWTLHGADHAISHNDFLALMTLSFVCLLASGGFLFMGRRWLAAATFPIAFLLFMVPLPDRAVDLLETASKLASAEAADLFFNISGTPFLRDGLLFKLPNIVIEVAQECSGIRSSWVLFVTSILASYLFLKSPWRRALLVAFVIPLGILRNGFRIMVIGLLCVHGGPEMIHSLIHRRGGPFFFALALLPLFFVLWWLRRTDVADQRMRVGPAESPPAAVKPLEEPVSTRVIAANNRRTDI